MAGGGGDGLWLQVLRQPIMMGTTKMKYQMDFIGDSFALARKFLLGDTGFLKGLMQVREWRYAHPNIARMAICISEQRAYARPE